MSSQLCGVHKHRRKQVHSTPLGMHSSRPEEDVSVFYYFPSWSLEIGPLIEPGVRQLAPANLLPLLCTSLVSWVCVPVPIY